MYICTRTASRCIHFVHVLAAACIEMPQMTVLTILRNILRIKPHILQVVQILQHAVNISDRKSSLRALKCEHTYYVHISVHIRYVS